MQDATQAATGAMTQAATTAPSLPVLAPSYSFSYPAGSVNGVALSHDGESLLLVRRHSSIDAWDALTYWWPEAAIGLALLFLLIIGLRISRRPNAIGEPHCGKCGYLLKHLVETRCPECGNERATERPRFGRRRGWRIGVIILIAAPYAYLARFGHMQPIRQAFFCDWIDWPIDSLMSRSQTTMQWLKLCTIECTSISKQVLAGGPEQPLVPRMVGRYGGALLLQRGRTLALCGQHEVTLVNTANGDVIERRRLDQRHGCLHPSTRISHTAAVTESDQPVIWVLLNTGSVRKWNLETDVSEEVLYLKTYDGRGFAEPLAAAGRVALPTYLTHEPALQLLDDPADMIVFKPDRWRGGWPSLSPNGELLAWNINDAGDVSIELLSRANGSLIQRVRAPIVTAWSASPLFSADGSYLIATLANNSMDTWIVDVASGRWIAMLNTSARAYSHQTIAVKSKPARIVRTGHAATFVVDVFDLDRIQSLP